MHIKDHSAAMKFFRTYDNVASKGKWKEFVDEMEFDSMLQEPRTMVQEPRTGFKDGNGVYDEKDLLGKRVRELMDEGYEFGEAVRQAMKEGYAEGGRTGFYQGKSVVKSHGAKIKELTEAGYSAEVISKRLGLKRSSVNNAMDAMDNGLAGEEFKLSKPRKDITKLRVNKTGKNLKDPKYIEILTERINNPKYKNYNMKQLVGEGVITVREYKALSKLGIEAQHKGRHSSDAKKKARTAEQKKWFDKYSKPKVEYKTRGTKDIHRHHAGGLREKVSTENTMFLEAQDNYKNIRKFEDAINDIQNKQYKNNLNRSLSTSKKKQVFEALAKEEAALRVANPKFSPYKSSLIFEESALGKGTFKFKEVMEKPELTVSEGKTGQKFAFKKATQKETQEIVDLTKKGLIKLGCGMYAGGRVGFKVGSGKCITKGLAKLKSGNLSAAEKKIVDAMGDGLKKGGMPKKFWTTALKGEGYFALADFANNLTKGQSLDKSFSNAVEMATFGALDIGGNERDLMKYAKERGLDTEAIEEWMDYAQTYGKYAEGHQDLKWAKKIKEVGGEFTPSHILNPEAYTGQIDEIEQAESAIEKAEDKLGKQYESKGKEIERGSKDMNEAIEGVVAKEWNKTAGTPFDRGLRKMVGMKGDEGLVWGGIGALTREGFEKLGLGEHEALKGFKPQTVLNYHPVYGYKEGIKSLIREGDSPMEDMLYFMEKYYPDDRLLQEALRENAKIKEKEDWEQTGWGLKKRKKKVDMGIYDN